MLKNLVTKEYLQSILVPESTDSYVAIPHIDIINATKEMLDKKGLVVVNETYRANADGNKMVGMLRINEQSSDMGVMIAFKNSYDRSMSLGFAAGAQVIVCENGVVSGEINLVRKHTGSVVHELNFKIEDTLELLEESFESILHDSFRLKDTELTSFSISQHLGLMYFEEELFTPNQVSIIRDEFKNSSYPDFKDYNAWSLYNWCTHALKSSHALNMLQNHISLHKYMLNNF